MKKSIKVMLIMVLAFSLSTVTIFGTSDALEALKKQEKAQQEKQKDLEKKRAELVAYKNDIKEQFGVIEERMEAGDKTLQNLIASIADFELQIADVSVTIEELGNSLKIKQNEISQVKLDLESIKKDKEDLHRQAKERIRVMYEYGDTGPLDVIFESENLMDMFGRLEYINRLVDADNAMFESLDKYESDILGKEAELEIHENTLEALTNKAVEEKKGLEKIVTTKNIEVEHANDLIDLQEKYQATLENEEKKAQNQLDAIKAEEKRVDKEIDKIIQLKAAEINRINGYEYSGGMVLWPVPGWTNISSKFGPRFHPIQKKWKNHNGIDIPATRGTPIIAVMDGEVVLAKYSSSYGNYAVIAHGNGYVSLYGHCSSLLVKTGQKVKAGQTIAKVGTTGWSTGNHLHFGFKKDGVWVNPLDYTNR